MYRKSNIFNKESLVLLNIQPYLNKLDIVKRKFYENLLHEIDELFDKSTFTDNSRLEGLYLLGFHNQAYDLKLEKEKSEEKSSEE